MLQEQQAAATWWNTVDRQEAIRGQQAAWDALVFSLEISPATMVVAHAPLRYAAPAGVTTVDESGVGRRSAVQGQAAYSRIYTGNYGMPIPSFAAHGYGIPPLPLMRHSASQQVVFHFGSWSFSLYALQGDCTRGLLMCNITI